MNRNFEEFTNAGHPQTSTVFLMPASEKFHPNTRTDLTKTPSKTCNENLQISWIAAFTGGGLPNDAPLLEELGINFSHIQMKTSAVLNPFHNAEKGLMEDTDVVGPLLFSFLFGLALLLSGKVHFGFIYGITIFGCLSIFSLLNLMSENGIDMLRVASILGYCLLPMVIFSFSSVILPLKGLLGILIGGAAVLWCTMSASNMFVLASGLKDQRFLVAYPLALFYFCFALVTVF